MNLLIPLATRIGYVGRENMPLGGAQMAQQRMLQTKAKAHRAKHPSREAEADCRSSVRGACLSSESQTGLGTDKRYDKKRNGRRRGRAQKLYMLFVLPSANGMGA